MWDFLEVPGFCLQVATSLCSWAWGEACFAWVFTSLLSQGSLQLTSYLSSPSETRDQPLHSPTTQHTHNHVSLHPPTSWSLSKSTFCLDASLQHSLNVATCPHCLLYLFPPLLWLKLAAYPPVSMFPRALVSNTYTQNLTSGNAPYICPTAILASSWGNWSAFMTTQLHGKTTPMFLPPFFPSLCWLTPAQ